MNFQVKIRVKPDKSGVVKENVKHSMNPFDEIALEQAVQLKEQGVASEVILVSIGDASVSETLRAGLAVGADRAILVDTTDAKEAKQHLTPLNVAKALTIKVMDKVFDIDKAKEISKMLFYTNPLKLFNLEGEI